MRKLKLLLGALVFGIICAFIFVKYAGVEIATTPDAFANPVIAPTRSESGNEMTLFLDVTPAPWPQESVWIYRLANLGVPVRISLQGKSARHQFVIVDVDSSGRLVIPIKNRIELEALLETMR